MFKNYFKTAWRNLLKNKTSTIINVGGLTVGMAIAMLIALWVWDELSFDEYHKNYDHIAQVMQQQKQNGIISTNIYMPIPIGKELQNSYGSDFKYVVMSSLPNDGVLNYLNNNFSGRGIYMDKDAPAMFSLKMIEGSYESLKDIHSVIIAASLAKTMFGDKDAVNTILKINNKLDVKVTGVYKDLPFNCSLNGLNFIASWDLYKTSERWIINADKESKWDNNSFQTFVQIADNTSFEAVDKKIINSEQNRVAPEDKKLQTKIFLNPMRDWHLRSHWDENGNRDGGFITYVRLFSIIGVFVLLLACINFMNLSTARSEKRAKEVGIRKTIGSLRSQIISQFYCESFLIVCIAFILSILLVQLTLPFFNDVSGKKITVPYLNIYFWMLTITFVVVSGFIAGSYPALYLSSFKPIKVLKGTFKLGVLASLPRKILVTLQFTISILLVIGTIVIYNEVQYTKNRPIGYNRNGVMMVRMKTSDFYGKFDLLQNELKKSDAVTEFAEASGPVTDVTQTDNAFTWPGKDPNQNTDFVTEWITQDYGKAVNWQIKDGRDFSKDFVTDSSAILLNEAAVKFMGLKNPVGTIVRYGVDANAKEYKVIGVVGNMIMGSPFDPVQHTVYFMDENNVNWIIMKLNPRASGAFSIAKIKAVFDKYITTVPFDYKFADAEFAAKFSADERIGKLSTIFASLAIFISCLGLFGLASFVAEQRTKEIGIRKILGASVLNLWGLLSKDFIVIVLISILIATPIAYYFMHNWLQNYQYRTNLSWWIFALTGLGALMMTLITVSLQAIKAAIANPVKSLRTE
jgi:putative ABC transport system permease protein